MINNDATSAYQRVSACGATPIGQILSLYDTILRDFLRAIVAIQAGDIETRVFELNHALLVIAHLQNVLDFERGGNAAKQFGLFYTVARAKIVQANIDATPKAVEELIDLFGGIRQAWYQAEQQLALEQQPAPAPKNHRQEDAPASRAESDPNEQFDAPQVQWSA